MSRCRIDPNMINSLPWLMGIGPCNMRDKTLAVQNHVRYMLDRTCRMFKWDGLPETIPDYIFESMLQGNGHCAILKKGDNYYAVCGSVGDEPDVYYRGTKYIVANPAIDFDDEYDMNKIVFARNDHYTKGLIPLCNRYATMLAENELSMWVYNIVTRAQMIIKAGCDADKLAADNFLCDLEKGALSSVLEHNFTDGIQTQPGMISGAGMLQQMIEYEQYLRASWYNDLGLDCNYNMKRESLTAGEISTNSDALLPLIDDMFACRKQICEDAKRVYGLSLTVDYDSSWADNQEQINAEIKKAGEDNAPID